eukprot:Phypoly_transcript_06821.p1 GENE.Phypoly_transcript_06821~~Phypoly_transcript_06821.p1  ORF type:complete len:484 (+),score=108.64 Phypoly_transcript_06821:152-1603(+)
MSLVSKTNTYNETAFDVPLWKTDVRLGFDPPEDEEDKRREKEWLKQFQKQKQQQKVDWENYEKDSVVAPPSPKPKEREEREKRAGGIGSMLSSAMKPNIKKLVRHGIPSELRANIWFEKSGASKKKSANPGVYAKYVAQIDEDAHVMEEIQMDIARTFTMHLMFANQMTKKMMLRILASFTIRNPNYGYCQNMTFIVGIILFFLPEEDAFWLFTTIMEDILFVDFCSPTMIGLRVDQKVLETLIKERLPKLHAHFTKYNIDVSVFTTSWLLRLFVNVFPIETTLRVWDCFLFEGSKILFRVALAYLKLHEEQLKQCTDSGDVMTFLSSECKMFYDADRLIKACASFWALRRKQINELRARFIEELGEISNSPRGDALRSSQSTNFTNSSNESSDEGYAEFEYVKKSSSENIKGREVGTKQEASPKIEHNEKIEENTKIEGTKKDTSTKEDNHTPATVATNEDTLKTIREEEGEAEDDDEYDLC